MSEISELTKKIDGFILTIGGHVSSIKTCDKERVSLFNKIEGKNGVNSRLTKIETREKVRSGYFTGILGIIGLAVSITVMVVLLFRYIEGTGDRYRGTDATRDLGVLEKRLDYLESKNFVNKEG